MVVSPRVFVGAGFDPVLAVEWDRSAAATYAENFGDHVICDDIAMVPDEVFSGADAVVGGPPCQGFSNLGTRNPDDPRNLLWREYVRVIRLTRPAVFVLENVPQFLKSDQFRMLVDWSQDGPLRGYELTAGVLNAADYGVPQRRRPGHRRRIPTRLAFSSAVLPRQRQRRRQVGDGTRRICGYSLRDRSHGATGPPVGGPVSPDRSR